MKATIGTLAAAAVLTACATTGSAMDRIMGSWVGEHVDQVIKQWGYPAAEQTIVGRRLVRWHHEQTYTTPVTASTTGTVSSSGTINAQTRFSGGTVHGACTRTLELDAKGIVVGYQYDGNNCCLMAVAGYCKSLLNPRR